MTFYSACRVRSAKIAPVRGSISTARKIKTATPLMTKSAWRSRAYAFRYIITFTVSATAVPLIAWLHSTQGFSALFLVMSGVAVFIFLAVLMLPRTGAILAKQTRTAE